MSDNPSQQTWLELEKKLDRTKRGKKRKPTPLSLGLAAIILLLLLATGVLGWLTAREHQARNQANQAFIQLQRLQGEWRSDDKFTSDAATWQIDVHQKDVTIIGRRKTILSDKLLSASKIEIEKIKNTLVLRVSDSTARLNDTLTLESVVKDRFIFKRSDAKAQAFIRFDGPDRYFLQLGAGAELRYDKIK